MTVDPWKDDKLNRRADGEHLISVLLERYLARKAVGTGSYILNIDAAWGEGKTFFLDCLRADLERRGHLVASVNAWRDDHSDEPLITVMAAVEDTLKPYLASNTKAHAALRSAKKALGIIAAETAKQVGFHLLKAATGIAVEKTLERLTEAGALSTDLKVDDKAFDKSAEHVWDKSLESLVGERAEQHRRANEGIAEFRRRTGEAIEGVCEKDGKSPPMFVFVDELDRCRPLYAIRLLEDLKHLFDIDGLVFVVATDSDQLSHSVKAIYGAEFEARKYLRRFFDRVFVFPEVDRAEFLQFAFERAGINIDATYFATGSIPPLAHIKAWANDLHLSNRDIVQILEIVQSFVTSWQHKTKIEPNLLLAFTTLFYRADHASFARFANAGPSGNSSINNWNVRLRWNNLQTGANELRASSADDYLRSMLSRARNDLPTVMREEIGSPFRNYFEQEFRDLYGMRHPTGSPPSSILNEYPSRVRNAGRVIDQGQS